MEHLIEIQRTRLPQTRKNERNLQAKLIIAELAHWASIQASKEVALIGFREMLASIQS